MVNFFPLSTLNVAIYKTTTYRTLEDDVDTNNQLIELQHDKKSWNHYLESLAVDFCDASIDLLASLDPLMRFQ